MIFLLVLVVMYATTWLLARRGVDARDRWRFALGGAMVTAGVAHLVQPTPFVQHLPMWVPARELLVAISGVVEVGLGGSIVFPHRHRRAAGVILGLFLIVVFPANVYVAVAGIDVDGQPGGVYPWVRLAFQPLFVWLAVWSTRAPVTIGSPPTVAA